MAALQTVDTLLHPKWIIPIVPTGRVFSDCSLAIHQGKIVALAPRAHIEQTYTAHDVLELPDNLLMPGLVNAHGHAAMSLLRGYADDLALQDWLENHIWPAEAQWLDETFVKDGTALAIAEMIRSGTTCFSDMYFFPEAAAAVAAEVGIRARFNFPILDFPTPWASNADEALRKGLALFDQYRSHPLISIGFGPHAPYTLGDDTLRRVAVLADELQAPVHIHVHETASEVEDSVAQFGQRPLQRLQELGLLNPQTQCIHMTQVNELDLQILRESGASVVHCPESNLKLASGFCPVGTLLAAGINVALGTDGAASNNDLDMLGEMHTAALLAKAVANDAAVMSAHQALSVATLGGAKALGLDAHIGSIEVGKCADLIALQLDSLSAAPVYNIASELVYSPRSFAVKHLWVAGRVLLRNGELTSLNVPEVIQRARYWQQQIKPS